MVLSLMGSDNLQGEMYKKKSSRNRDFLFINLGWIAICSRILSNIDLMDSNEKGIPSQHSPGRIEENPGKLQSG